MYRAANHSIADTFIHPHNTAERLPHPHIYTHILRWRQKAWQHEAEWWDLCKIHVFLYSSRLTLIPFFGMRDYILKCVGLGKSVNCIVGLPAVWNCFLMENNGQTIHDHNKRLTTFWSDNESNVVLSCLGNIGYNVLTNAVQRESVCVCVFV